MQLERNGKVIEDIKIYKTKITLKINDEKISISKEAYYKMNLYIGKPITDKEIEELKEITSISKALSYIYGLFKKKRYSVKEIKQKLHAKNLKTSQISSILEILTSSNLVNDEIYKQEFIYDMTERCYGKNRIIKDLNSKGIVIDDGYFSYKEELEKAKVQVKKLERKFSKHSYILKIRKIHGGLLALGFDEEVIEEVISLVTQNERKEELLKLQNELEKAVLRLESKLSGKLLKEKVFALLIAKGFILNDIRLIWEDMGYENDC